MSVAIGKLYREGNNLMARAKLGPDGVSKLYPWRLGSSLLFRGKDCAGEVVYGFPFRHGTETRVRAIHRDCDIWCCLPNSTCQQMTVQECLNAGGHQHETEEECLADCTAPPPPTRPCCLPDNSCEMLTIAECESRGGRVIYHRLLCDEVQCVSPQFSCCYPIEMASDYVRVSIEGMAGVVTSSAPYSCPFPNIKCITSTLDVSVFNGEYYVKLTDAEQCTGLVGPNKPLPNGSYAYCPRQFVNPTNSNVLAAGCPAISNPPFSGPLGNPLASLMSWIVTVDMDYLSNGQNYIYVRFEMPDTVAFPSAHYRTALPKTCTPADMPAVCSVTSRVINQCGPAAPPCNHLLQCSAEGVTAGTATVEFVRAVPRDWKTYLDTP